MDNLVKGETPHNISQQCRQLCADYLYGRWTSPDTEITTDRISGGFTNQLYSCSLSDDTRLLCGEPKRVVIKLYGQNNFKTGNESLDDQNKLMDPIIAVTVAARGLVPKVYACFAGGQIIEFVEHKRFSLQNQCEPAVVDELAAKLAIFHSLKVPIRRSQIDFVLTIVCTSYSTVTTRFPDIDQLIEAHNLDALKARPITDEIEWIRSAILASRTPFVFCHNDFRNTNIMVKAGEHESGGKLIFCDTEDSRYGHRGNDFATLFCDWGRETSDFGLYWRVVAERSDPEETLESFAAYPKDETIVAFLNRYLAESAAIYGDTYAADEKNSVRRLLAEVKLFSLLIKLFVVLAFLQLNDRGIDGREFDKILTLKFANYFYSHYFHLKRQFTGEHIFEHLGISL